LSVPLQLQMLPSEMLSRHDNRILSGGRVVRQGIEFDVIGRRAAYHFYRRHPGDDTEPQLNGETERVPASEVIHLVDPVDAGQLRGYSRFASVLAKLFILDAYDDAELDRKKVAAMFAGFVTHPAVDDLDIENGEAGSDALLPLKPGQLQVLEDGESITFSSPSDVGGNYECFQYRTLLQVAAGLGLPYANLPSDMVKANYSNTRAALLEFRRKVEAVQHSIFVFQLCRPVWQRWMDAVVLSKAVNLPDYEANRSAYLDCDWMPPRLGMTPFWTVISICSRNRAPSQMPDGLIETQDVSVQVKSLCMFAISSKILHRFSGMGRSVSKALSGAI
jgi:lambda family phage portal protein